MEVTLDCKLNDLINPTSRRAAVGRLPRSCADWCDCLNRRRSQQPSTAAAKLEPLYPAELKSNRGKPADGHPEWNFSTRINPENPFPPAKVTYKQPRASRNSNKEQKESIEMNEQVTNSKGVYQSGSADQQNREPGKSGQGKNVKFTCSDESTTTINNNNIEHQETHYDSTRGQQQQGQQQTTKKKFATTIRRRHPSEFSTRWPPTPIRSTHSGQTTAGRRWPGEEYDNVPFYNHYPAGIPTIYTGSVGECMRWNYGF